MTELKYASIESQLYNDSCDCDDTEEMFWLREADDYDSKVRLGNLLSRQYRFHDAIDAYHLAELIRADDPMLYVRLGGAYLSLFQFEEAKEAYDRSVLLSGDEKSILFQKGIWYYLKKEYSLATDCFSKVLPCGDEMAIAVLYWHGLSCMRGNICDNLIGVYREDMVVGHHTAYRDAVEVIIGRISSDEIIHKVENDKDDLNYVIALYGIYVYLNFSGKTEEAKRIMELLLERNSVWPCVSYLAAWNDKYN